ncbi:hypothetical protein D210916BOD24_15610 [Alteromonas sp. D210916BOD_24]|uniref:hypothetical protein n=1 Tax=Alteromonas sp. D210916BOD_24 TaxID=3157618 RepID=UPI00399CF8C2
MSPSNSMKMKTQIYPRRYVFITIEGVRKLACYMNEEWIIDSTCKSINEMLEAGVVGEEAVQGWVNLQPATSH